MQFLCQTFVIIHSNKDHSVYFGHLISGLHLVLLKTHLPVLFHFLNACPIILVIRSKAIQAVDHISIIHFILILKFEWLTDHPYLKLSWIYDRSVEYQIKAITNVKPYKADLFADSAISRVKIFPYFCPRAGSVQCQRML